MMPAVEGLLTGKARWRLLGGLLYLLLLTVSLWLSLLAPARQQHVQLQAQYDQLQQQQKQLQLQLQLQIQRQQRLLQQKPSAPAQPQSTQLRSAQPQSTPFQSIKPAAPTPVNGSPGLSASLPLFELIQRSGVSLRRWRPAVSATAFPAPVTPSYSELIVACDWQQALTLLDLLADQHATPRRFSLQTENAQLIFTLQLDTAHENPSDTAAH